jgi:hypothetical protein
VTVSTFCRARQFDESIAVKNRLVINIYEYGVKVSKNVFMGFAIFKGL